MSIAKGDRLERTEEGRGAGLENLQHLVSREEEVSQSRRSRRSTQKIRRRQTHDLLGVEVNAFSAMEQPQD